MDCTDNYIAILKGYDMSSVRVLCGAFSLPIRESKLQKWDRPTEQAENTGKTGTRGGDE